MRGTWFFPLFFHPIFKKWGYAKRKFIVSFRGLRLESALIPSVSSVIVASLTGFPLCAFYKSSIIYIFFKHTLHKLILSQISFVIDGCYGGTRWLSSHRSFLPTLFSPSEASTHPLPKWTMGKNFPWDPPIGAWGSNSIATEQALWGVQTRQVSRNTEP